MRIIFKLFVITYAILVSGSLFGKNRAVETVRTFGENLSKWCEKDDPQYKKKLLEVVYAKGCFVEDDIMQDFAAKMNMNQVNKNVLNQYLAAFSSRIPGIRVVYSNIRLLPQTGTTYSKSQHHTEFVSCDIEVTGTSTYNVKDVFYITDGKVSYIDKYQTEKVAIGNGKTVERVVIKASVMDKLAKWARSDPGYDDDSFGLSYGYSKLTTANLTFNYAIAGGKFGFMLQIGCLGKYEVKDADIINKYSQLFYGVIGPKYNMPYCSLGCGVGLIEYQLSEIGVNQYNVIGKVNKQWRFMVKPQLSIPIPVNMFSEEGAFIAPYVGYNIVPAQKELNTWEFGIGLIIQR